MVIDAAKGIEARTRKLFEVCRLRDIPIVTFINKMDRESRDPFELLDEIEKTLALDTAPVTWPLGRGRDFVGTFDVATGEVRLLEGDASAATPRQMRCRGARRAQPQPRRRRDRGGGRAGARRLQAVRSRRVPRGASDAGVFRLGAEELRRRRPARRHRRLCAAAARAGSRRPPRRGGRAGMSAFVFKIQANMDPNHRDRIAFARICSGKLTRGMKVKQVRTGKPMSLRAPHFFFAQDRALADEAFAGDVVGIPNHGALRIGDTLTEGEDSQLRRRAELCAGNPAPRAAPRRHEGEEAQAGAAGARRGGRRAGVPPDATARPRSSAWSARCSSTCCACGSTTEYGLQVELDALRVRARALDHGGRAQDASTSSSPPTARASPTISTAISSSSRATVLSRLHPRARAGHRFTDSRT